MELDDGFSYNLIGSVSLINHDCGEDDVIFLPVETAHDHFYLVGQRRRVIRVGEEICVRYQEGKTTEEAAAWRRTFCCECRTCQKKEQEQENAVEPRPSKRPKLEPRRDKPLQERKHNASSSDSGMDLADDAPPSKVKIEEKAVAAVSSRTRRQLGDMPSVSPLPHRVRIQSFTFF